MNIIPTPAIGWVNVGTMIVGFSLVLLSVAASLWQAGPSISSVALKAATKM